MVINETNIFGCFLGTFRPINDKRGQFVKTFSRELFHNLNLDSYYFEDFYSISNYGVLRGLHFQEPPFDQTKFVYCQAGEIFDVILDLRKSSPSFGHSQSFNLSKSDNNFLYLPKGIAHGFCSLTDGAIVNYKVSEKYSREHDSGIFWNSINIDWPVKAPLVSERDSNFVAFSDFNSPFL
jgi:dTDP-4-dehydrorhamnose 3,5-epimerase